MRFSLLWFLLFSQALRGEGFSTEAPDWYQETLGKRLTPLEEVIGVKDFFEDQDERGIVLLSERVARIREDGGRDMVYHFVYRALTEKGADSLGRRRISFSGKREKIHFLSGQTILPDGRRVTVPAEGVFVQREEGDEDAALYDDRQDLVIIFPEVKAGSTIEMVVLVEDLVPVVEKNYSGCLTWSSNWPVLKRRAVYGVENPLAGRFSLVDLGSDLPHPKTEQQGDWTWWTWERDRIPPTSFESRRPPMSQIGPATWITTFSSWDELGKWYWDVLSDRGEIGEQLSGAAERAVKGSKSQREVLDRLFPLVARKIRYTGLEFGRAGLRPYSCEDVWSRKYGDCKDKANLLVALLRKYGVPAWVGLVQTADAGLVVLDAPGTSAFNHAIVVVDAGGEELVFCDPTISYGKAGVISPSVGGRNVLLVKNEGSHFVPSPDVSAGHYHYQFDLAMDPSGRLSGWMGWKSAGYYASGTAKGYDGVEREVALDKLTRVVGNFFEGAEVVDVELPENLSAGADEVTIRAFFTTPARDFSSEGRFTYRFPVWNGLLMDFSQGTERETNFHMWRDQISVGMRVKVPPGLIPDSLPSPLDLQSMGYAIKTNWHFENQELKAGLKVDCSQSLLEPQDFTAADRVARRAGQWFEEPLILKKGTDWQMEEQRTQVKLPVLPTGQGQLDLVDRWYPAGGNEEVRTRALERVMELFPDDNAVVFGAKTKLAYQKYAGGKLEEAQIEFKKLSTHSPPGVDLESQHFATYMQGICLGELKKHKEARDLFEKVAEMEELSDYRRQWSLIQSAENSLNLKDREAARESLKRTWDLEGDYPQLLLYLTISAELPDGRIVEAVENWKRYHGKVPSEALDVLEKFSNNYSVDWMPAEADYLKFLEALENSLEGELKTKVNVIREALTYQVEKLTIARSLRAETLALLEGQVPEYFGDDLYENLGNREDYFAELERIRAKDSRAWLIHSLGYLKRFEVDENFTSYLWSLYSHVTWVSIQEEMKESELVEKLRELTAKIPRRDENYWESQFVTTGWLEHQSKWKEAEQIYAAAIEDPLFDKDFEHTAYFGRGRVLERLKKWDVAIDCYLHLKKDKMEFASSCLAVWKAGMIMARLGRFDEALDTWSELAEVPVELYEEGNWSTVVKESVVLAESREKTLVQWKQLAKWWADEFQPFAKMYDFPLGDDFPVIGPERFPVLLKNHQSGQAEKDLAAMKATSAEMAVCARWLPTLSQQFYFNFLLNTAKLDPAMDADLRSMMIKLCTSVKVGETNSVNVHRRLMVAFLIDSKAPEAFAETEKLLDEVLEKRPSEFNFKRETRERAVYLFAIVARQENRELARAEAELRVLFDEKLEFLTSQQVAEQLAITINASGDQARLVGSIEELLASGKIPKEKQETLRSWLEAARGEIGSSQQLILALRDIEKDREMSWLPHVQPEKLGEGEFESIDDLFNGKSENHSLVYYRWRRLLLEDGSLSPEQQQAAFLAMIRFHYDRCVTVPATNRLYDQLIEDERIPESLRIQIFWMGVSSAAIDSMSSERLQGLIDHRFLGMIDEDLANLAKVELLEMVHLFEDPETDRSIRVKRIVGEGKVISTKTFILDFLCVWLISKGYEKEFEESLNSLEKLTFDVGSKVSGRMLKLKWKRTAREWREKKKNGSRLFELFEERLTDLSGNAGEGWKIRRGGQAFHDLPGENATTMKAAFLLFDHYYCRSTWHWWGGMLDELLIQEQVLNIELLKQLCGFLSDWDDDFNASMLTLSLAELVTKEEIMNRSEVLDFLKKWQEDVDREELEDLIQLSFDLLEFRDDRIFASLTKRSLEAEGESAEFQRGITAVAHLLRGTLEEIEEFISEIPEEELMSEYFADLYAALCRKGNLDDEADLIEEEISANLDQLWMEGWKEGDSSELVRAARKHWLVGSADSVPAWLTESSKSIRDKSTRMRVGLWFALAREDWQQIENVLSEHPEIYAGREKELEEWQVAVALKKKMPGSKEKAEKLLAERGFKIDLLLVFDKLLRTASKEPLAE